MYLKLKNLLILLICFVRFIFFGKSNKTVNNPKKILIVQMAKLGDMVCTTPMFRAVKERYPNANIFVGGNELNKKLLEYNKDVDGYIVFSGNFFSLIKKIKKERFDFACITGPDFLSLSVLYLSGLKSISAPVVVNGYSPYLTKSYKFLLKFVFVIKHRMGYYAPREYLKLLEPIDIFTSKIKKYLDFSKEADEKIYKFFVKNRLDKNNFIVGISVTAGNKIKEWDIKNFARIINYIKENYDVKIILIGSNADKQKIKILYDLVGDKVVDSSGLFNLDELKSLISKLKLFISVDTGPVYIAEAFDIPTIDIVGPMDEKEQPPLGVMNRIVKVNRNRPELHIMNARVYDKDEALRQVREITTDMVISELDNILSKIYS